MGTGPSELRLRKYDRWFSVLDVNRNGYLERDDYVRFGMAYGKALGLPEDSPKCQTMVKTTLDAWDLQVPVGTAKIGKDEWIAGNLRSLEGDPETLKEQVAVVADAFFDACDADDSGTLSRDEHRIMLQVTLAVPEDEAGEIFDRMDLDKDGSLSRDEFRQSYMEFLTSDDPKAPGNWFFGRF